jgi:hypothetical protein
VTSSVFSSFRKKHFKLRIGNGFYCWVLERIPSSALFSFLRECSVENVIAVLEVEVLGTLGALRFHSLVSGGGFLSEL